MVACHYSGLPTSVQIICNQPKQLASTRTTDTEVSSASVAAVESLGIAGQDKIFHQYLLVLF